MAAFCREQDLDPSAMYKILKGTAKTHKGFSLFAEELSVSDFQILHEAFDEQQKKIESLEKQIEKLIQAARPKDEYGDSMPTTTRTWGKKSALASSQ